MTAGIQCDTCRKFTPEPDSRWLHVVRQPGPSSFLDSVLGSPAATPLVSFCTVRCLAEYAIARALVEGQPAPEEPAP